MKYAVNYSRPAEALWRTRPGAFDLFKLPAWPELAARVSAEAPCYIHFSLKVTGGSGVRDTETKSPVNFDRIEKLLRMTATPLVNIHLAPKPGYHADIAPDDTSPSAAGRITERMLADVNLLVRHFGAEHVIAENDAGGEDVLACAVLPAVIRDVITGSGCGLLFDISHARLAARALGMEARAYIAELPLERMQEMHLTGIQYLDQHWQDRLRTSGLLPEDKLARYRERWMDHLPLTDADWEFLGWGLGQIGCGAWSEPWVAACEIGGLGGFFEATMDADVLSAQLPRLGALVQAAAHRVQ